jgi:hypothetical protein
METVTEIVRMRTTVKIGPGWLFEAGKFYILPRFEADHFADDRKARGAGDKTCWIDRDGDSGVFFTEAEKASAEDRATEMHIAKYVALKNNEHLRDAKGRMRKPLVSLSTAAKPAG